jgi:hypothetical protein
MVQELSFNGLKSLLGKLLVLLRGLELLARGLNPWRVMRLVQDVS